MLFPNRLNSLYSFEKEALRRYWLETALVLLIPYAIAMGVQDLGAVFGLTGSLCSSLIAFVLPSIAYLKFQLEEGPVVSWSNVPALFVLLVGLLSFVVSPFIILFDPR